jgi:hypothetical protein
MILDVVLRGSHGCELDRVQVHENSEGEIDLAGTIRAAKWIIHTGDQITIESFDD